MGGYPARDERGGAAKSEPPYVAKRLCRAGVSFCYHGLVWRTGANATHVARFLVPVGAGSED